MYYTRFGCPRITYAAYIHRCSTALYLPSQTRDNGGMTESTLIGDPALRLRAVHRLGEERGRGGLLGVQPYLTVAEYVCEDAYFTRLDGYLTTAHEAGLIDAQTVVVFPEFIGAWLVMIEEPVSAERSMRAALAGMVLCYGHKLAFLRSLLFTPAVDRVRSALFTLKAAHMAAVYTRTFARLARDYGVTIVAGSIVLPDPCVADGVVRAGDGPLYNVSALFDPDGRARAPLTVKVFPTAEEQTFLDAGSVDALPVYNTPAGRLGVLICADAWFPESYAHLRAAGVEVVAVPSYTQPAGKLDMPWTGYSGYPAPADVDPTDVGRLTHGEAWARYALAGRLAASGARAGLLVGLRGCLWEVGTDGALTGVLDGQVVRGGREDGAALFRIAL